MLEGLEDKNLVAKVLSGNRSEFVQLVKQYEGLVLHIVTPLIGVNEDREDICQDIFIKVYERLNTFQFKSKLSTWIGNIAYNTSINFLQKKKNILMSTLVSPENELYFIESINSDNINPEQIIIKQEDIKQLNQSIDKLTEFQKAVILLFYQDELSLDEIGKVLEIPVNTVKSHLFRARNSLKQLVSLK